MFRHVVPLLEFTADATVQNVRLAVLVADSNRFHHPQASACTVTGVYVHMLAPKASRAVVGVSVAVNLSSAVFANEFFDCPGKAHFRRQTLGER
jgi:hypothetical protein